MSRKFRIVGSVIVGVLPMPVARLCYRWFFGYKIGKQVKIGFSIIDVDNCEIGDNVTIGHLNVFSRTRNLSVGDHTRIGVLNVFRGGNEINIGRYCEILRMNEFNSIPEGTLSCEKREKGSEEEHRRTSTRSAGTESR